MAFDPFTPVARFARERAFTPEPLNGGDWTALVNAFDPSQFPADWTAL